MNSKKTKKRELRIGPIVSGPAIASNGITLIAGGTNAVAEPGTGMRCDERFEVHPIA
jgi:hypothetical protein